VAAQRGLATYIGFVETITNSTTTPPRRRLRLALKTAILETGKSQRELARETAIPESRLSQIVRGWADPREVEEMALAMALGRPSNDLFG
jgi:hypothetical protein